MNDPHSLLPDAELARRAAQDEQAFEVLVRRHGPTVTRVAAGMVGPGAVDDVVQEVFISVHRGLRNFRGDAQFTTWLHRITLNACYQALGARRNVPFENVPDLVSPLSPVRVGEQLALRDALNAALASLPHDQREAVTLRELAGLEYAQIAELTGVEVGTVKSRINRGRVALRAWLTRAGVKP